MFITINNKKYKKICTFDTIHVKKQHNKELFTAHYWNVVHGHKGFVAA